MQSTHIVNEGTYGVLDVFGPTLELLILPEDVDGAYCVMTGTIPRGVSVPLHSHPDIESFLLVSGAVRALSQRDGKFEWLDVRPGELVHVPSNAKHAWRNTSSEPAVQLITTTPKLGRFFQEIGRPITAGAPLLPPTPDDLNISRALPLNTITGSAAQQKMPQSGLLYLQETHQRPRGSPREDKVQRRDRWSR